MTVAPPGTVTTGGGAREPVAASADKFRHWVGPVLVAVLFCALSAWSWRRWADPLVDFGRELYTPWRLAEGSVLYRDVAGLFGPFSQYLNAALFHLFGVSLTTLIMANLLILAGLTLVVYRTWLASLGKFCATSVSVVLLAVFGFSQYTGIANYNFVTPYAHEATHGVAASVLMIYAFHRWLQNRERVWAAVAGACLGITALTKPEIGVAATISAAAGLALARQEAANDRGASRSLLVAIAFVLLPMGGAFVYFASKMPLDGAAGAVLGAWRTLLAGGITKNPFYLWSAGVDRLPENVWLIIRATLGVATLAGVATAADWLLRAQRQRELAIVNGLITLLVAAIFFVAWPVSWIEVARALPVLTLVALGLLAVAFRRVRHDRERWHLVTLLIWGVFAFTLLGKIALNSRLYHYGFYLAMPATLFVVGMVLGVAPRLLGSFWGNGTTFRAVFVGATAAAVLWHVSLSNTIYAHKSSALGNDGDLIWTLNADVSPTGATIERARQWILRHTASSETVLVVPEGIMINYLTRRVSPTRYINFMPPEVAAFSEGSILNDLQLRSPDVILVTGKDVAEYGVPPFGTHSVYGKVILDWVQQSYTDVEHLGQRDGFWIRVLRRLPRHDGDDSSSRPCAAQSKP